MRRVLRLALAAAAATLLGATQCYIVKPDDPLLDGDVLDPLPWDAAEIVPGAPWIRRGRDRVFGTDDDFFETDRDGALVRGDLDLVLRTGLTSLPVRRPPPASARPADEWPRGVAEPFGAGTPIAFAVGALDGWEKSTPRTFVRPPYWSGLPVLVMAFADLDGDGFVGVTNLDGDAFDAGLEEAEWEPVARKFAFGADGVASGALQIGVGGPPGHPVRVALAAAAWAGDFDPAYLGGNVPNGPAVMTRLPFVPDTDPRRVLDGPASGPPPATPGSLVGVEIRSAVNPDPNDPRFGESFTLRLDGSDPTIDAALVESGAPVRFGAVRAPDPASYQPLPQRPLRLGLDASSTPIGVEVLQRLWVADDGGASAVELRIVALDRLGNVTAPAAPTAVSLLAAGPLSIVAPDADADGLQETIQVSDARGVTIRLDDAGGAFDAGDAAALRIGAAGMHSVLEVLLPDPDVDDSGLVDDDDVDAVHDRRGERLGDPDYLAALDLDASGRIDDADVELAEAALGATPSVP